MFRTSTRWYRLARMHGQLHRYVYSFFAKRGPDVHRCMERGQRIYHLLFHAKKNNKCISIFFNNFVELRTRLLPSCNIELCRSILNSAVRIALAPRNASQRQNRDSETWAIGGGGCYTGAWECEQAREINKELAQKRPDQCRSSFKFVCFNFARKLLFFIFNKSYIIRK